MSPTKIGDIGRAWNTVNLSSFGENMACERDFDSDSRRVSSPTLQAASYRSVFVTRIRSVIWTMVLKLRCPSFCGTLLAKIRCRNGVDVVAALAAMAQELDEVR